MNVLEKFLSELKFRNTSELTIKVYSNTLTNFLTDTYGKSQRQQKKIKAEDARKRLEIKDVRPLYKMNKLILLIGIMSILILSLGCSTCDNIKVTTSWESRSFGDIKPNEIFTDGTNTATLKITINNDNDVQMPVKINVDIPNAYNIYCREIVTDGHIEEFSKLKIELHPETIGPKRSKEWYVEYKSMNEIEGDYKINISVIADDTNCGIKRTTTIRLFE